MSTRRRLLFTVAALVLSLLATVTVAEALVRLSPPTPRVQVVRLDGPGVTWTERDGIPLWWDPLYGGGPIRGPACAPGALVVGIGADSILMTIEPEADGHRVADDLREALGVCVRDASWPGILPYQELELLKWIDAETPLSVGVLLVWKEDRRFWKLGDSLYDSEIVRHDPVDGLPVSPVPGLPKAVHAWLFTHLRVWEYATLAVAPIELEGRDPAGAYLEALAWASDRGLPLVVVEGAPLQRPLPDAVAARAVDGAEAWKKRVQADAAARGFPYVVLAEALQDQDVAAIRLDTCCHYNRKGHALVAAAVLPHVQAALARAASQPAR